MNDKVDINIESKFPNEFELVSCHTCKKCLMNLQNLKNSVRITKTGSGKIVFNALDLDNKDYGNYNRIFKLICKELKIDDSTLLYASFTPITKDTQDYEYIMNKSLIFKDQEILNKKFENVNEEIKSFSVLKSKFLLCNTCKDKNTSIVGNYIAIKVRFNLSNNNINELSKIDNNFSLDSGVKLFTVFIFNSENTYLKDYKRNQTSSNTKLFIVNPLVHQLKTNVVETIKLTNHVDTLNKNLNKCEKNVLEIISNININMDKLKELDKIVSSNSNTNNTKNVNITVNNINNENILENKNDENLVKNDTDKTSNEN